MDSRKSYYAIIPANVRYDRDLPANAKLLYGEITALCNEQGYCWASNQYFAKEYGVAEETVSRWVKALAVKGYIELKTKMTQEGASRKIYLNPALNKKVKTALDENIKDNSIDIASEDVGDIIKYIERELKSVKKLKEQLTEEQAETLIGKFGAELVIDILGRMENYKPLNSKYKSVYRTANNWCKLALKRNGSGGNDGREMQY